MNGWAIGALICAVIVGVTAILIGSHAIAYVVMTKAILGGGLFLFGLCLWKVLGCDMHKNARG